MALGGHSAEVAQELNLLGRVSQLMARVEGNEILRKVLGQGIRFRGWGMRQGEPYRSQARQAHEAETGEYGPQTGPWPAVQQR